MTDSLGYSPNVVTADQLDAALDALAQVNASCAVIAGGTDLIAQIKQGLRKPDVIIDISRIEALRRIEIADGKCVIGPLVTHRMLEERTDLGVLSIAAGWIGSPQVRVRGTVGGNLANASPAADTAAALIALGAEVALRSKDGERSMLLEDFFTGPGETALERGELLTSIGFDLPSKSARGEFSKLGQRNALAISIASVALHVDGDSARICLGSVAPTPVRARKAEELLKRGKEPKDVGKAAREACQAIDDVRASAWYREEMVERLTSQLVAAL